MDETIITALEREADNCEHLARATVSAAERDRLFGKASGLRRAVTIVRLLTSE